MTSARAAVSHRHGEPLSVEQIDVAAPGPGYVAVDVGVVAICHSDITYADGGWGGPTPAIYGHEGAGFIRAVGEGIDDLRPGARVAVGLLRACGGCFHCVRDEEHLCMGRFDETSPFTLADGRPVARGLRTGAFSSTTVVHRSQVVPIPDDVPLASGSLLACGVLTGYGSVTNTAPLPEGATAAVIGTGGVGLGVVQGARLAGASRIVGVDLSAAKLDMARSFGVTDVVDASLTDPVRAVHDILDGVGPDFVYVAVGARTAIQQGLAMARRGGTIVLVGMPASGVAAEIEIAEFADAAQTIVGSKMGSGRFSRDVPALVNLYRTGSLKLDEMVTGRFPLHAINEAISEVRNGAVIRNVIEFESF